MSQWVSLLRVFKFRNNESVGQIVNYTLVMQQSVCKGYLGFATMIQWVSL